jgi:hypothetical protein
LKRLRQPSQRRVAALAASGMNDVLNDRAYTQAAWWNRIPAAAWDLMISIAVLCNLLLGYGTYRTGTHLFLVFPLALSISFLLISDLDAPRGGCHSYHAKQSDKPRSVTGQLIALLIAGETENRGARTGALCSATYCRLAALNPPEAPPSQQLE